MTDTTTWRQRKRARIMKLVHGVMDVGESLPSKKIMDRIIDRYGPGHTHIPKNTYALSSAMKAEKSMTQVHVVGYTARYLWRRNE